MSGTVSYSRVGQEVGGRNLRLLCSRACVIKVTPVFGYLLILSWRFVGLIPFSIYATECFFREKNSSYDCQNFTLFSHPMELEVAWQATSIVNTVFVILVLVVVPGYDGYLSTLRKNAKHARFWSLFLQLLVSVAYNIIVICNHPNLTEIGTVIETMFIFEEISTTLAVYFWSGVPAPWKNPRVPTKHWAYKLTLVVFILENFFLFLLGSTQAAFKVSGINKSSAEMQTITLVMNAAEATLFYSLMKFFWNKLFYGDKNMLVDDNC